MKLTRILALAMVAIMAVSMPAMAERKVHTVTINNIQIQLNDEQATKLGLEVSLSGGGDEDRSYVNFAASGNNNSIVDSAFSYENERITLALDGMTSNYTVSKDELEKLMEQSMDGMSAQEMPFDPEDLQELIESYIEALEQTKELGKKPMTADEAKAFYEEAGFVIGAEETVAVNGIEMTLLRYDLDMDTQGMDKLVSASLSRLPAMKEFMAEYVEFVEEIAEKSGEKIELDPDHLFSGLYSELGSELRVKATVWTDEKGENIRMELEETITEAAPEEGTEPVSVTVPMTMQVNTDDAGQHMTMDMTMNQQGVEMTMNCKVNDAMPQEGAKGDFAFNMVVMGEQIDMNGEFNYDAIGKGEVSFQMDFPMGENSVSRTLVMVSSTGGDVNTNSLRFTTMQLDEGAGAENATNKFSLGFDVTVTEGTMPEGALIDNGKETVELMKMTKEQQDKALEELMTKGIMAYGQLMATDGVAQLVSDMVMAFKDAYETMTDDGAMPTADAQVAA